MGRITRRIIFMRQIVQATRAELDEHVDASERRGDTDRRIISDLEVQASVDHAVIERLQAEEVVDRLVVERLRYALSECRRLGLAIGIVMASRSVGEDEAFAILDTASQHTNRKLREVADDAVRTGEVAC
jgi:AmiR/NasT family two-component response regulator